VGEATYSIGPTQPDLQSQPPLVLRLRFAPGRRDVMVYISKTVVLYDFLCFRGW